MNWEQYVATQKQRKKYARRKSYVNLDKEINDLRLQCYSSYYNNNASFFIGISKDSLSFHLPDDELKCIKSEDEQLITFKNILKFQLSIMKSEPFKSCTNSTFHYEITPNSCKRVSFYPDDTGFVIDRIIGMDISENDFVYNRPNEHKKRIEIIEGIIFSVFPNGL